MRRARLVAGLAVAVACAVACAVAPVAAFGAPAVPQTPAAPSGPAVPSPPDGSGGEAMPPPSTGPGTPTGPPPPAEPAPSTEYVVWGCITGDATPAGAPMRVIWGNRHMRTALGGFDTFTVGIDAATAVRTGWPWQHRSSRAAQSGGSGVAGLRAGDIVAAFIMAPSGTAATALPAAGLILDFGRMPGSRSCGSRR